MESIAEAPITATVDPRDVPRTGDGMIDIRELVRQIAEDVVNEIMDAEADQLCEASGNSRNGYRTRALTTCVGTLTLRVPKLRSGSFFPEDVLERYQRADRAVVAAVAEMYATGTSTRKVGRVAERLGIDRLSKDQVSAMARSVDDDVEELMSRPLGGLRVPYVWLDATYCKARREGHVASTAVVTAIGCDEDGWRRVLGMGVVDTESHDSWLGFLRKVRSRGVRGVQLVVSDAHEGLRRAISEVFQGAAWQRCVVHLMRDCVREAGSRAARGRVASALSPVFAAGDPDLVRAMYHEACDVLGEACPRAAGILEEAEADALAYLDFPPSHWGKLRTNNCSERTNREIKRRTRVIQVFPSTESLERVVGAVMCSEDEGWAQRRYLSGERMAELYEAGETREPPSRERLEELGLVARKAIEASMEVAGRRAAA